MGNGASQAVVLRARGPWKAYLATLVVTRPLTTILACVGVWVGWVTVKFLAFHSSGLGVFPDTSIFVWMGTLPWTSLDLWGGQRTPTGALFFKVAGGTSSG
jgi:hypothetical protein